MPPENMLLAKNGTQLYEGDRVALQYDDEIVGATLTFQDERFLGVPKLCFDQPTLKHGVTSVRLLQPSLASEMSVVLVYRPNEVNERLYPTPKRISDVYNAPSHAHLPCQFQPGQDVYLDFGHQQRIERCCVLASSFTSYGKTIYDIEVLLQDPVTGEALESTTMENIDSAFVFSYSTGGNLTAVSGDDPFFSTPAEPAGKKMCCTGKSRPQPEFLLEVTEVRDTKEGMSITVNGKDAYSNLGRTYAHIASLDNSAFDGISPGDRVLLTIVPVEFLSTQNPESHELSI